MLRLIKKADKSDLIVAHMGSMHALNLYFKLLLDPNSNIEVHYFVEAREISESLKSDVYKRICLLNRIIFNRKGLNSIYQEYEEKKKTDKPVRVLVFGDDHFEYEFVNLIERLPDYKEMKEAGVNKVILGMEGVSIESNYSLEDFILRIKHARALNGFRKMKPKAFIRKNEAGEVNWLSWGEPRQFSTQEIKELVSRDRSNLYKEEELLAEWIQDLKESKLEAEMIGIDGHPEWVLEDNLFPPVLERYSDSTNYREILKLMLEKLYEDEPGLFPDDFNIRNI